MSQQNSNLNTGDIPIFPDPPAKWAPPAGAPRSQRFHTYHALHCRKVIYIILLFIYIFQLIGKRIILRKINR